MEDQNESKPTPRRKRSGISGRALYVIRSHPKCAPFIGVALLGAFAAAPWLIEAGVAIDIVIRVIEALKDEVDV